MGLNRKLFPLLALYQENQTTLDPMIPADAAARMNAEQDESRLVPMSEVHDWATAKRLPKRFSDAGKLESSLYAELQVMIAGKQASINFASESAAGTTYTVTNRIVTAGGRTEDRSLTITCYDR